MPRLEIHEGKKEEVYRDIVRIPEISRLDDSDHLLEEGRICRVRVGPKSGLVILRGVSGLEDHSSAQSQECGHVACIHMDEVTRRHLGIEGKVGESMDFRLEPVTFWGEFLWAWTATEIGYKIASRLALLGLFLGLLGFVLALPEFVKWISEFCH